MIKQFFSLACLTALLCTACSDDSFEPVVERGAPPVITAPASGSTYTFTEDVQENIFDAITWTAADFGYDAAITYTIQMDQAGSGFAEPVVLGVTNGLAKEDLVISQVNNFFVARELSDDQSHEVEIRLVADVGSGVEPLISESVTWSITPFAADIPVEQLQVPGSYQGWEPADSSTAVFSRKANNQYEGYVFFPEAGTEFKYTQGPTWTTNWGDDNSDGTLEGDGANILASDAGVYKLNVDLVALTHEYLLTKWGVLGDATPTGTSADTDFTVDPATGIMKVTLDLTPGGIRFRANDDDAINMGDNGNNGSLEYDGADIPIAEAGNYTIELILNQPERYTYTVTKN